MPRLLLPLGLSIAAAFAGLVVACGLSTVGTGAAEPGEPTRDAASGGDDAAIATGDAPPEAPDTSTRFCDGVSPPPTFCDDFDDPAASEAGALWDKSAAGGGSTLALATTAWRSAPRSLHATSSSPNAPPSLAKAFSATTRYSIELDVMFGALPSEPSGGDVAALEIVPADASAYVVFYANQSVAYFQDGNDEFSPMMAAGTGSGWHHVAITISAGADASLIDASIDGTSAWTAQRMKHRWSFPTNVTQTVGAPVLWRTNAAETYVDNVVVRVQ